MALPRRLQGIKGPSITAFELSVSSLIQDFLNFEFLLSLLLNSRFQKVWFQGKKIQLFLLLNGNGNAISSDYFKDESFVRNF